MTKEEGQNLTNFFKPSTSKAVSNEPVNFVRTEPKEKSSKTKNTLPKIFEKSLEKRSNSEKEVKSEVVNRAELKALQEKPLKNFFKPKKAQQTVPEAQFRWVKSRVVNF